MHRIFTALLLVSGTLGISGCATPTSKILASLPDRGNVVNGRDSIHGDDFAFLMHGGGTGGLGDLTVVEFDGKPFFIEYKSPVIWEKGKWIKTASPILLRRDTAPFVIAPGKHSLTLTYHQLEQGILVNTAWNSGEKQVEFVAEKGHGYNVMANCELKQSSESGTAIRVWAPTIVDRDAGQAP